MDKEHEEIKELIKLRKEIKEKLCQMSPLKNC